MQTLRQLILPLSLGKLLVFSLKFDPVRGTSFNCLYEDHFHALGIQGKRISQVALFEMIAESIIAAERASCNIIRI